MRIDASKDTLNIEGFDRLPISERWYLGAHTPSPCCAPLLLLCGLSAPLPSLPSSRSLQHTQTWICRHAEAANRREPVSPLLATQSLVARRTARHETPFFLSILNLVLTCPFFSFDIINPPIFFVFSGLGNSRHCTMWWHLFHI